MNGQEMSPRCSSLVRMRTSFLNLIQIRIPSPSTHGPLVVSHTCADIFLRLAAKKKEKINTYLSDLATVIDIQDFGLFRWKIRSDLNLVWQRVNSRRETLAKEDRNSEKLVSYKL